MSNCHQPTERCVEDSSVALHLKNWIYADRYCNPLTFVGHEGLDIKETAEVVLYDLRKRRGINVRAVFQHQAAVTISGSRYEKLRMLDVPTLVIHGTADQFIPVEHGRKLVDVIPNAEGLWLDGVGHIFPVPNMDALTKIIIAPIDAKLMSGID